MRWKKYTKPELKQGHVKYKTKFLLRPKTIGGETRWLETATIRYEVFLVPVVSKRLTTRYALQWRDTEWVDTELIENAIGMKIKFNESHSFAGELMTMSVNGHQHLLEMNKNQTYEQHAVKLLKDIYNVDFNVEDVKFEWDGSL